MIYPVPLYAVLMSLFVLQLQSSAKTHVLFLGLSGEGAPAIERSFDRALRDRITTTPDITAFNFNESQRFRRMLDLDRSLTVSEGQLNTLEMHLPDSVLIVWAQVKKLEIAPVRKNLIRINIHGELQSGLTVYNLSGRRFSYCGSIESAAAQQAGFILFSPISLETVSAAVREVMIGELIGDAVTKSTNIIDSLRRSELIEPESIEPTTDTAYNRPPSISDVFTVPSVEAAEIPGKSTSSKKTQTDGKNPSSAKTGK